MDFLDFNLTHYLDALAGEYRARGFDVSYQPFAYAADFLPLVASTTDARTITLDHDSDFVLCYQAQTAFTAAAFVGNPNILVRITSESSQRNFMNQQVHLLNIFGTGQRPHILMKPLVYSAKSAFTVELQNLAAVDTNVRLTFLGVKAFLMNLA